jgi:hypothetical protein
MTKEYYSSNCFMNRDAKIINKTLPNQISIPPGQTNPHPGKKEKTN